MIDEGVVEVGHNLDNSWAYSHLVVVDIVDLEVLVVQLFVVQLIGDHQLVHCRTTGHFVADNLDIDHID